MLSIILLSFLISFVILSSFRTFVLSYFRTFILSYFLFLSFVLSFFLSFFRSFFGQFSIAPQYLFCAPFSSSLVIIIKRFEERRKEGGPGKKKFERRDKKKALETRTHKMERSAARLLKIQWFNKKKRTTTKKFTHRSRGVYYIHFFRDSHAF